MSDWTRVPFGTPRIEQRDALTLAGIRERYAFEGFDFAAFPAQAQRMTDLIGGVSERMGEAVYDVFWEMFDSADAFEYFVGVEISNESQLPNAFTRLHLPTQQYATFRAPENRDPRDTIFTIWHDWLPASGYAPAGGPQFLYLHGQGLDPNRASTVTEIWLPVTA